MKKSVHKSYLTARSKGETPKGGWGRAYGVGQPAVGWLRRKAGEGKLAGWDVGVVGKALEMMARNKRAA